MLLAARFARFVLVGLSCLALPACRPGEATAAVETAAPNVVYILSDTHRWGAMSFTRTPGVRTPNLETLKRQGISFNRYYTNLPLCTPHRAMLLTGRWPYQQGLIANHMRLDERVDLPGAPPATGTLGWAFKLAGYITAHIGKWHLGGHDARPFGFDRSIVWSGTNDHRRSQYSIDGGPIVTWTGRSNAIATTTQALDWIEAVHRTPRPFFVVISLNPPHGPFDDALEEKQALYPDERALPFHPLDRIRNWTRHRDYHALVSTVDDQVGRVIDALDRLGLAGKTILIYTSDHGAMGGVGGVAYGQKRHPNDESTRVPFFVRWPGTIPADVALDTLFSTIDVFPTLAGLTGLRARLAAAATPAADRTLTYVASLPGVDLSRRLLGEPGGPDPASIFLMHPSNMNNRFSRHEIIWRAIVTSRYTYAVTATGEYALWDNDEPYQTENLVGDPATRPIRLELWGKLRAWINEAETPFLDNWFARASRRAIEAWNTEHGLDEGPEREVGKPAVFDILASKPQ